MYMMEAVHTSTGHYPKYLINTGTEISLLTVLPIFLDKQSVNTGLMYGESG